MTKTPPMTVKRLPEPCDQASRRSFLREVKEFVDSSHGPRLIVDLSAVAQISPESIDLLLECVGHTARGDGEVVVTGAASGIGEATARLLKRRLSSLCSLLSWRLRTTSHSMTPSLGSRLIRNIEQPSVRMRQGHSVIRWCGDL